MSLINAMLAGLEDRQAYLSEGQNLVLEGLSPVNDDNFHKTANKSYSLLAVVLIISLVSLLSFCPEESWKF